MLHTSIRRVSAVFIACILVTANAGAAFAQQKASGKASSYDEAYYVSTDYYGNIVNGSVVKSYTLNGQKEIRDKGSYDSITNLSDGKAPEIENGEYVFRFGEDNIPDHFYYECSTKAPYAELPWDISISYKLNGVTADAEDLPGKAGMIEIDIDAVPNQYADEYALNNYTLETAAVFDKDEIDSLEAEGAQIQLLGNLKTVLFVTLPGEEQHVNIKVGTDNFSFGGLTFLLVPATLGQLSELSRLADNKEKLEEDYRKFSDRLDDTIEMIDDIGYDMGRTAGDLKQVASDADKLSGTINPLVQDLDTVKHMVDDTVDSTDPLLKELVSLKAELSSLGNVINSIQSDMGDADEKIRYLSEVKTDLEDASDELVEIENDVLSFNLEEDAPQAYALYSAYVKNFKPLGMSFKDALPQILSPIVRPEIEKAVRAQVEPKVTAEVKAGYKQYLISKGVPESEAEAQAQAYIESAEGKDKIKTNTDAYMATPACAQMIEALVKQTVDPMVTQYAQQETQIKHLYNLYGANVASPSDTAYDELALINDQLTSIVEGVSAPEALLDDMSSLIGNVKDYKNLINDFNSLGDVAKQSVVDKGQVILDEIDVIDNVINLYRPSADKLLEDAGISVKELTEASLDTGKLLENLSDSLMDTSDHINKQESLRVLKDDVSGIIEDTWKDYTGDKNRLLLMDPDATPVSLTSSENPAPESIQVVIRTQEIKPAEEDDEAFDSKVTSSYDSSDVKDDTAKTGNVFTRIGDMFTDIWHTITGIFTRRDK